MLRQRFWAVRSSRLSAPRWRWAGGGSARGRETPRPGPRPVTPGPESPQAGRRAGTRRATIPLHPCSLRAEGLLTWERRPGFEAWLCHPLDRFPLRRPGSSPASGLRQERVKDLPPGSSPGFDRISESQPAFARPEQWWLLALDPQFRKADGVDGPCSLPGSRLRREWLSCCSSLCVQDSAGLWRNTDKKICKKISKLCSPGAGMLEESLVLALEELN